MSREAGAAGYARKGRAPKGSFGAATIPLGGRADCRLSKLARAMRRTGCAHTSDRGGGFFPECLEPLSKPRAGLFHGLGHRRPPKNAPWIERELPQPVAPRSDGRHTWLLLCLVGSCTQARPVGGGGSGGTDHPVAKRARAGRVPASEDDRTAL
jgi:hypothetical protein